MATRPKKPRPARSTQATEGKGEELTAAGKRGNEQPDESITEGDHDGTGMGVSDSEEWESDDGLCEYERRRMRNIRENRALMASLNLLKAKEDFGTAAARGRAKVSSVKRAGPPVPSPLPTRRSLRLQRMSTEGMPLPPPPPPAQEEEWARPPRKPSGPIAMECVKRSDQSDEQFFRLQLTELLRVDRKGESPTPGASGDCNRTAVYARLRLNSVAKVTPKRVLSFQLHPGCEKTIVAAGDTYGNLGIWDADSGSSDHVFLYEPHSRAISGMVFPRQPSSAHLLYTCSYDGTLRCADFERGVFQEIYATAEDTDLCLTSCDLSNSSDWLMVSQGDGSVVQLDPRVGRGPVHTWQCHQRWIKSIHLNPADNSCFITASSDCSAAVWDIRKLMGHKSSLQRVRCGRTITSAYFSPLTGRKILTTSMDNYISVCQTGLEGAGSSSDGQMIPLVRLRHNNQTGRWLSTFKAQWDPCSEKYFTVGSMAQPRQIHIFSALSSSITPSFILRDEQLNSVCSLVALHPRKPLLGGANSSGRVFLWS